MSSIPEPWASRLIERGFTDRRSMSSRTPSLGALADKIVVNTTTISEAIAGKRKPSVETVKLLMKELGPDIAGWLEVPLREPYEPPPEADLLTDRQRKALTNLIRSFVSDEQEEGAGDVANAAQKNVNEAGAGVDAVVEDGEPVTPVREQGSDGR